MALYKQPPGVGGANGSPWTVVNVNSPAAILALPARPWSIVVATTSLLNALAVTLPNIADCTNGDRVEVKDANGNASEFNITVSGDVNIDGQPEYVIGVDYENAVFVADLTIGAWMLV